MRSSKPSRIAHSLRGVIVALLFVIPAQAHDPAPSKIADLSEQLLESVVNISIAQTRPGPNNQPQLRLPPGSPFQDFFEDFMKRFQDQPGQQNPGRPQQAQSLGSGFILDPSGLIVTNHHVIVNADEITVTLADGAQYKASVLGRDAKVDLAVLKITADTPLKAVQFGDSDTMRVGEWVLAIGNPFGLGSTVTAGIISARNRNINSGPYDDFIQTDAAINRGNSGGPLFNLKGQVIGINTAIISPSGGSVGVGFAIPINTALPVITQLRTYGETRRGWLGVRIQTVSEAIAESLGMEKPSGALVAHVENDSPADKAGIKIGDVILAFDGQDVPEMSDLPRIVALTEIGKTVIVKLLRQGQEKRLAVEIGRLDESDPQLAVTTPLPVEKSRSEIEFPSLGLELAPLSTALREAYSIADTIDSGLVITAVDPSSKAAQSNLRQGHIILKVNHAIVSTIEDFRRQLAQSIESQRQQILLLVSSGNANDQRFIALPYQEDN